MATSVLPTNSIERTNFARLCKLLIDVGTRVLKDVFDSIHPPQELRNHLMDRNHHRILKNLKIKGILPTKQWNKLYPSAVTTTSANFDVSLLLLLLRKTSHLPTPAKGWNDKPLPTSINIEDDVVRIKLYRNLLAHSSEPVFSDTQFTKLWNGIETVLVRLGGARYKADIDRLRIQSLDPEDEKYYIQCLQEWYENEETENRLMQKDEEKQHKLAQALSLTRSKSTKDLIEGAEFYSQKLKTATRHVSKFIPNMNGFPRLKDIQIDDVFTNLTIDNSMQNNRAVMQLANLEKSADIFVGMKEKRNPKSILISGQGGTGKSLLSHKIAYDWARGTLDKDQVSDIPGIKFTYLLTFKQLNLLRELSLAELLNESLNLDDSTSITEEVIDYILQHPEQLMLLIDSYDEFHDRHKIANDFENHFPNDIKAKMPVAALVGKLVKKKILRDSIIMITSRPTEAYKLEKSIRFEKSVEIVGFSESQVLQFVDKYFHSKQTEVRDTVLHKIKETPDHYIAFGRTPFMCHLMCESMESVIMNKLKRDDSNPETLTEFYCRVVQFTEKNYNKAIISLDKNVALEAVAKNLDNFSRLSAELIQHNKFNFNEEDLEELKFTQEEILHLTSSGLLCCNPVASNSPFQELAHEYSFTDSYFQEFFAARFFVSMYRIPTQGTEIIFQFMSGLMASEKNENLMLELLDCVAKKMKDLFGFAQRLVSLRCLYEYKDQAFMARHLLNESYRYWNGNGEIRLYNIKDLDCRLIAMLIDRINAVSHLLSPPPHGLYIELSFLTCFGLNILQQSLTDPRSTVTALTFSHCSLVDEYVECLSLFLASTKIAELDLSANGITDNGVLYIMNHCPTNLTLLNLSCNPISDGCKDTTRQFFQDKYPSARVTLSAVQGLLHSTPRNTEKKYRDEKPEDQKPREKDEYQRLSEKQGYFQTDRSLDENIHFQNLIKIMSSSNDLTDDEIKELLKELSENCSDGWKDAFNKLYPTADIDVKRNFVNVLRLVYHFLLQRLSEYESEKKRNKKDHLQQQQFVDVTFLAHGEVRSTPIPSILHYYNDFVESVNLYVPWGCKLDATVAYAIATGEIGQSPVRFSGKVFPKEPLTFNTLSPDYIPIPDVVFSPLATKGDPAFQELLKIDNEFKKQARGIFIPFLPDHLSLPEVHLWHLCIVVGLLGRHLNVKYRIHVASCLYPMLGDDSILSQSIYGNSVWPTVDCMQYCAVPIHNRTPITMTIPNMAVPSDNNLRSACGTLNELLSASTRRC